MSEEPKEFRRICEICGKPEYWGYAFEHTPCGDILARRDESLPQKIRRQWENLRKKLAPTIYQRDGEICHHCGTNKNLTIDHIKPISKGGTNDLDNLQVLCLPCNLKKRAK